MITSERPTKKRLNNSVTEIIVLKGLVSYFLGCWFATFPLSIRCDLQQNDKNANWTKINCGEAITRFLYKLYINLLSLRFIPSFSSISNYVFPVNVVECFLQIYKSCVCCFAFFVVFSMSLVFNYYVLAKSELIC